MKLTSKKESFELKVNYKGEDGKLTPVELSEQADKSFVGKIVVKSDIQIFTSFEDTNTAIAEQVWEGIEVYPNPFRNYIIVTKANFIVAYRLVNMFGEVVRQAFHNGASSTLRIDTQDLREGSYVLQIEIYKYYKPLSFRLIKKDLLGK